MKMNERTVDSIDFRDETDYLAARNIAASLLEKGLLQEDEFKQIDDCLKAEFHPHLMGLMSEYPAY